MTKPDYVLFDIIAEGLPERQTRELVALSKKLGKWIIGPATVGGFVPGAFKIGNAGGALSNLIMSKLYRSGSAGFVSKSGGIKKSLIAWVTGTSAKVFPSEVQFGHASAMARGEAEAADAKNAALKAAGAIVPNSYDDLGDRIRDVYEDLKAKGVIEEKGEVTPQEIPVDYKPEIMRRPTNIMSTISDDRGEELLYAGVPISKVIQEGYGVGTSRMLWNEV